MHIRGGSSQWQSRRNITLGPIRRAHPASGAMFNVQIVRGKITSRCLWHACRALMLGIILMMLGAGMATIGYYADQLSVGQEIRGNATVRVKNESRGFHLNNLSYVGPIVMGVGGFIVVAACVMTFEARDSAAKVVPARFKLSTTRPNSNPRTNSASRRTTGCQSGPPTAFAARWEQHMGVFRTSPGIDVPSATPDQDRQALTAALVHFSKAIGSPKASPKQSPIPRRVSRSGSVPNLTEIINNSNISLTSTNKIKSPNHRNSRNSSLNSRNTADSRLLHTGMLQLHRQALSVDEGTVQLHMSPSSAYHKSSRNKEHRPNKRSDTARRHVLSRQKPIEKEELHNHQHGRRRSSTISDASICSKRIRNQVESQWKASPEKSPKRVVTAQLSTPSVEREFRSQLSVCSEPSTRVLSCQSSIEPLQEEFIIPKDEEEEGEIAPEINEESVKMIRPDTLNLDSRKSKNEKQVKFLYRSNSSKSFKKPKTHNKLNCEFDQIYFIESGDDGFNSIDVIDERRKKNFNRKIDEISLEQTETINSSEVENSTDEK